MTTDGTEVSTAEVKRKTWLTLDWWAVLLAFVLALLVRANVLQHISW
jgi:hypothetical protein